MVSLAIERACLRNLTSEPEVLSNLKLPPRRVVVDAHGGELLRRKSRDTLLCLLEQKEFANAMAKLPEHGERHGRSYFSTAPPMRRRSRVSYDAGSAP